MYKASIQRSVTFTAGYVPRFTFFFPNIRGMSPAIFFFLKT